MQTLAEVYGLAARQHEAGRLDVAASIYEAILEGDPNQPEALHGLSVIAGETGNPSAAAACLAQAIRLNPQAATYYQDLALALVNQGRFEEAILTSRQAVRLAPQCWEAHYQLANSLHLAGRLEEAAEAYGAAILVDPHRAAAHFNLGVTRSLQNRLPEAVESYRRALRIRPGYAEAHNNLGAILQAMGCLEEAVKNYRAALEVCPDYADAHYNLALALQEMEDLREALAHYDEVLRLRPEHHEAHNNRGNTLLDLGRPAEALVSYREALRLQPGDVEAHWNQGVAALLVGDFAAGWEGYEWRLRRGHAQTRQYGRPLWDGSPYPDGTLLVHAEQGLGDTIQFARYLELARRRGGRLTFECQPALEPLLSGIPSIDSLTVQGSPPGDFDWHVPLLSLPRLFTPHVDLIPARVPYFTVDAPRVESWRRRLGHTHKRKVGLVWGGNPNHPTERRRGVPLAELGALAGLKRTAFYSLQRGPQAAELAQAQAPGGLKIIPLGAEIRDILDTAAILMNLDLLISADTMVAHLAGALARPVWTLLAFSADWRWLMEREDCPWYPSMRLFRQKRAGEWRPVLERVRGALEMF